MKVATYRNGTRDGALIIVSRDLRKMVPAASVIAGLQTLQQLLDDWDDLLLKVERVYAELNEIAEVEGMPRFEVEDFQAHRAMAPLPRAYQWADGSAYLNHVELVRRARGAEMPASFWTDPLMYQGGSDSFLGATEAIALADEAWVSIWRAKLRSSRATCRWGPARRRRVSASASSCWPTTCRCAT
jgi:fumarylacetoacetate (FAA) hydrolase